MQAGEVGREFQSGVRDEELDAVSTSTVAAAWLGKVH
jgi:hypothetical protein